MIMTYNWLKLLSLLSNFLHPTASWSVHESSINFDFLHPTAIYKIKIQLLKSTVQNFSHIQGLVSTTGGHMSGKFGARQIGTN